MATFCYECVVEYKNEETLHICHIIGLILLKFGAEGEVVFDSESKINNKSFIHVILTSK